MLAIGWLEEGCWKIICLLFALPGLLYCSQNMQEQDFESHVSTLIGQWSNGRMFCSRMKAKCFKRTRRTSARLLMHKRAFCTMSNSGICWLSKWVNIDVGWFSYETRTDLVAFDRDSVNASRYVSEVLQAHVIPFSPFIGTNFFFMNDKGRLHVTPIVTEYRNEVGIPTFPWPAHSLDLNPIKHI